MLTAENQLQETILFYKSGSQAVGHNPFGGLSNPFTGVPYKISCTYGI